MLTGLPTELLLRIVNELDDVRDKCRLSNTCTLFHSLLQTEPWCWSPLDLSPYHETLTNVTLLSFLRRHSLPIVSYQNYRPPTEPCVRTIQHLNISGCRHLSPEAILTVVTTLPHLTHLSLDCYSSHGRQFFEQREHLYQLRPSHNLSSLSMDLSKQPHRSLCLPDTVLRTVIQYTRFLQYLSLQHQHLSVESCRALKSANNLRHLNISSCNISQPAFQTLLRSVGRRLTSLKMLNIDLTNLTLLCLQQYGHGLRCLHLSCTEPSLIPSIARVVGRFALDDFRLTCLRTGHLDTVVFNLCSTLRRLDMSPKMEIYPKMLPPSAKTNGRHPPENYASIPAPNPGSKYGSTPMSAKVGRLSVSSSHVQSTPPRRLSVTGNRTEHDLLVSDQGLRHLATFSHLIELRLCFPTITASGLTTLLEASSALEILELRLRPALERESETKERNWLGGLSKHHLPRLRELHLYTVEIIPETADRIMELCNLRQLTIWQGGDLHLRRPQYVSNWLLRIHCLNVFRLGNMCLDWRTVQEVIQVKNESRAPSEEIINTLSAGRWEMELKKRCNQWEWVL
ncbi:uncharacterized protein BYT42DRAFT_564787 [Radiomyces spectabilis]|uniref:uncharacterized protein n=1 Tax=Radiomyces spectabilis TaxID=64574 RepID=UPI002220F66D|nr:uncharacterized protein BYT42DRAFT_564787 [Radiomyces spectabilis]KAI8380964.1 hypothetical protein BYT42DRAFT_564787 [Radiomyces spectabilis]